MLALAFCISYNWLVGLSENRFTHMLQMVFPVSVLFLYLEIILLIIIVGVNIERSTGGVLWEELLLSIRPSSWTPPLEGGVGGEGFSTVAYLDSCKPKRSCENRGECFFFLWEQEGWGCTDPSQLSSCVVTLQSCIQMFPLPLHHLGELWLDTNLYRGHVTFSLRLALLLFLKIFFFTILQELETRRDFHVSTEVWRSIARGLFWNINFSRRVFKGMIYYLHTCTTCITQDAHRCMAYGPVTPLSFIISHCYHYQQLSRRGPFLSFICAVHDHYAGWAVKWLPELSACVNWFNWRKFQVDLLLSFKWEATNMNLFAHPVGTEQCSQSFLESGFQSLFTPLFTSDLVFRPNHWRKCDSLADKCSSMFTSCLMNQIIASRHCWVKTDLFGCPGPAPVLLLVTYSAVMSAVFLCHYLVLVLLGFFEVCWNFSKNCTVLPRQPLCFFPRPQQRAALKLFSTSVWVRVYLVTIMRVPWATSARLPTSERPVFDMPVVLGREGRGGRARVRALFHIDPQPAQ